VIENRQVIEIHRGDSVFEVEYDKKKIVPKVQEYFGTDDITDEHIVNFVVGSFQSAINRATTEGSDSSDPE
jgi:hypothetical protein